MVRRRREPKPMGRLTRFALMGLALAVVCALGAIVIATTYRHDESATAKAATSAAATPGTATNGNAKDAWKGLEAAGIPEPGDWSRPSYQLVTIKDGKVTGPARGSVSMPSGTGAIDAALRTVNALLDPTTDDAQWSKNLAATLGKDGAGLEHPVSNAPRWWWTQRRFDADRACSADTYTARSADCMDGEYKGSEKHGAIVTQGSYDADDTNFPVPAGRTFDSLTNPQERLAWNYDTVLIPMDDGAWHVTVYCPADRGSSLTDSTMIGVLADKDGNETTAAGIGDGTAARSYDAVGFGTRQHPCVTVDVAVGGQKPFWYVGEDE